MKSNLYMRWDLYARHNDIVFENYCYQYGSDGFVVFFETIIALTKNDGKSIAKDVLTNSLFYETHIDKEIISRCLDVLLSDEVQLLKLDKSNKIYSSRVQKDVAEGKAKSDKCKRSIELRWQNRNTNTDTNVIRTYNDDEYERNSTNTNTNTNTKEKESVKEKTCRFSKPTFDEVKEYCEERKNNVNPQKFIDFYESKGWKVGNQSMKDWKACVRTWEQKEKLSTGITLGQSGHYKPEDYEGLQEKLDNGEDIF